MELVYLWVDDYKNIHQQGFNFSPRFDCKYDGENLMITPKEHLENFFGENINVTAIVGENGSGKSSILSSLIMKSKIFMVVFDDELKIYTNKVKVTSSLKIEDFTTSFLRKVLYYSMDNLNLAESRSHLTTIDFSKTNELIATNYLKLQDIDSELFNFMPYYIEYSFYDFWLDSSYEIDNLEVEDIKAAFDWNYPESSDNIINAIKALMAVQDEYLLYLFNRFEGLERIFENIDLLEKVRPKDLYLVVDEKEVQEALKECDINFVEREKFKLLQEHADKFLEIKKLEELFGVDYLELFFYKLSEQLEFDFMTENRATYSSLSHGEKTIYTFLVHLVNYDQKDFLFLLDEPDNTLHPNWQKKFLYAFINIAEKLKIKTHFLITSHSPFILSDIPKQNVIFLKDGRQTDVDISTFGANIHTLLSHGFFMENGLMGEFAKEKIQSVIDFLNDTHESNLDQQKAWSIIQLIGEPFLKHKLEEKFHEKFSTDEEKRMAKIKQLEDELERLRSAQPEN